MRKPLLVVLICLSIGGFGYGLVQLALAADSARESSRRPVDRNSGPTTNRGAAEDEQVVENNETFHPLLLHIAANYQRFGRVDGSFRFAPAACAAPVNQIPKTVRFSLAGSETPHDRKLYYLFAQNRIGYLAKPASMPVGQAIVKQSWQPVEVKLPTGGNPAKPLALPQNRVARHPESKKLYRTGKQSSLFVMVKTDPQTPGTDRGWVYGTLTPDGKRVTAAGRIQSCMECHVSAKRDRIFGLPAPPGTNVLR